MGRIVHAHLSRLLARLLMVVRVIDIDGVPVTRPSQRKVRSTVHSGSTSGVLTGVAESISAPALGRRLP